MRAPLPCAPAEGEALLGHEGRPVWPLRSESEAHALRQMVELQGGRLAVVDATPFDGAADRRGRVVALGEELAAEARLYAHLTSRLDGGVVSGLEDVRALADLEVIVTTRARVEDDLLEHLYGGGEGPAVGLVMAEDAAGVRREVLVRSAAAALAMPVTLRRLDVLPSATCAVIDVTPDWRLVGGEATGAEVRAGLGETAGVLSFVTHSNGVDAAFGRRVVLCPMDGAPEAGWDPSLAPTCVTNAWCFRKKTTVAEALAGGDLLGPGELRARVLVAGICFGLRPPPSTNAPLWSLSRRFLGDLRVGALVASWEIVTGTHLETDELVADLADGVPVGVALARHNRRHAEGGLFRMALVGDPRCALPETTIGRRLLAGLAPPAEDPASTRARLEHVAVLRAVATLAPDEREGGARGEGAEDRVPALRALGLYEEALLRRQPVEGAPDAPGPSMRRAVLDLLAGRWTNPMGKLSHLRARVTAEPREPCPYCPRRVHVLRIEHALPGPARRLAHCSNCGIVEDVPADRRLAIDLAMGPVVRPVGDLPPCAADMRFVLDVPMARHRRVHAWPAGVDGSPATELVSPEPWSTTPCRAALLVIWPDGALGVAGRFVRGEAWNAAPPRRLPIRHAPAPSQETTE